MPRKTRRARTHKRSTKRIRNKNSASSASIKRGGDAPYETMKYDTFVTERYFKNLELPVSVQTDLMARLNLSLDVLGAKVRQALQIDTCAAQGTEWKNCSGTCESLITAAMKQEIGSTAFMLKVLADSVIRPDGKAHRLKFVLDKGFFTADKGASQSGCRVLTGRWKDDAPFLHVVLPQKSQGKSGRLTTGPLPHGRLIMGFGPSASGKTYWAKTVLGLLAQADAAFPEVFFSVDGGLVRESSATYQFAKEMAHCVGYAGFTNLQDGLFGSSEVKKAMEAYLLQESARGPVSLYVPETLGGCEVMIPGTQVTVPLILPCINVVKRFLDITHDDSWIGLLIWQHKHAADHSKDLAFAEFSGDYACAGTTESGMAREKSEGKKYSNRVYEQSMKNGRAMMGLAPGGRYEIHNAGRRGGMSVLWDRSVGGSDAFSTAMKGVAGVRYVDARWRHSAPIPPSREENTTSGKPATDLMKMAVNQKRADALRSAHETGAILGEIVKAKRAANAAVQKNVIAAVAAQKAASLEGSRKNNANRDAARRYGVVNADSGLDES